MFSIPEPIILYINPLLVLLFLFVLYRGYKKGFLLQVLDLISWGVSAIVAWLFSPVFARIISLVSVEATQIEALDTSLNASLNQLAWFGILLILIRIILLVVTPLASLISKMPLIKQVNSVAGGIFSVVVYCVYVLLLIVFLSLPIVSNGQVVVDKTVLGPIRNITSPLISTVNDELNKNSALQSILTNRSLTQQQEDQMVLWLQSQGFTDSAIREFLNHYE
ncbi:hypothetical protein AOC36_07680 [Erysipelothrix larvae]|uniref:CvpA family protein n=1 Tax=Erysipelothrix larvae TaxID=1514105 RepID=A0A0X8H0K3_9FIRM|nr:CvpA family protein [Erysipelothrix larvae]AMC93867.1 hypothetical protein AOC36_07680 [Erysipelothrix larvae]